MSSTGPVRVTAASPGEKDIAGLYRMTAGAIGICGTAGAVIALADRSLGRRQRVAAFAAGSGTVAGAWVGFRRPNRIARMIHERPAASFTLGFVPLAMSPLLGGRRNPLWQLAIAGVGVSATVAGRRAYVYAGAAAAGWVVQSAAVPGAERAAEDKRTIVTFCVVPLAFLASAATAQSVLELTTLSRGVQETFDRTERDLAGLNTFRDGVHETMGPLRSALLDVREDLEKLTDPIARRDARADVERALGRLAERTAIVETLRQRPNSLARLLEQRVAAAAQLTNNVIDVTIGAGAEDPEVEYRALLLVAAFIPGSVCNVQRHAVGAERVRVSLQREADLIQIEVADDGVVSGASTEFGRGLSVLRVQAAALGGDLRAFGADDGFRARLELPIRSILVDRKDTITDAMFMAVDRPLRWSIRLCGAMVLAMSASAEGLRGEPRITWRVLNAGVALLYELAEQSGRLVYRPPAQQDARVRRAMTAFVAAAAGVTAGGIHGEDVVLSGWVNGVLARHALIVDQRTLRLLTAMNVLALFPSFRGTLADLIKMVGSQVTVTVLGPSVVTYVVRPATERMQAREWALEDAWGEQEQLHRVALAFETRHGWRDPAERVIKHLGDRPSTRRLGELINRSADAGGRLAAASGGYAGLAHDMAETIAEQVWPASVTYTVDGESFRTFPTEPIMTVAFRRDALTITRAAGTAILDSRPPNPFTRRSLEGVRLQLHLNGLSGDDAVRCTIVARPPLSATARAQLAVVVEGANGDLLDGSAATLEINLFPSAYVEHDLG